MDRRTIKIEEFDVVKYLKSTYLVKSFQRLESGKFELCYYFRSIRKPDAKLHKDQKQDFYESHTYKIKKTNNQEKKLLIEKIRNEYPDFNLAKVISATSDTFIDLDENMCIEFLKEKGYTIYKRL